MSVTVNMSTARYLITKFVCLSCSDIRPLICAYIIAAGTTAQAGNTNSRVDNIKRTTRCVTEIDNRALHEIAKRPHFDYILNSHTKTKLSIPYQF